MICIYLIYSLLSPHCYDMYYIYFDEVEEVRKTLTFLLLVHSPKELGSVYILHYTFGSSDLEIKSVLLKYITETYYYITIRVHGTRVYIN